MSVVLGDPALRLLARLKLRGALRAFRRRLRTVKGALFTLCGVLLFGAWMTSLFLPALREGPPLPGDPEDLRARVRLGGLVLTMLSLSSSFSHRGLFLPADEIQRLFAAPVSRRDLVRYRLLATLRRGVLGAIVVGLVLMRSMPRPGIAFLGCLCAVGTLPVLNQMVAIVAGALEERWARRVGRLRTPLLLLGVAGVALVVLPLRVPEAQGGPLVGLDRLLESGPLAAAVAPFEPWARMVTAPSWPRFLPWFALCLAIGAVLFECTVRLPVDFRELSLETSASVAARLRRVRRGGGVASGRASARLAGWRVPWAFGRSPEGALAWRKSAAILRKAKGTLWVSVLVLVVLTVIGRQHDDATILIAVLGTFYLTSGLRFDYRADLDRMEVIKAWPVSPARAFAATLLPEVLLVAVLVMAALLAHALLRGTLSRSFWPIFCLQPPFVFAWAAVDNAVFLFAPVRFVPGQEGALQNAGRGMLVMLLRMIVLVAVGALCAGPALLLLWLGREVLGWSDEALLPAVVAAAGGVLVLCDVGLALVGGVLLRRFDVARDRG